MSEQDDFYPILVPRDPIRVTFVVPMSKKTFNVWLQRHEPGGREQEDKRLLKQMGYPIEPKETLKSEANPPIIVKYTHVGVDGQILEEKDIYECWKFTIYPLTDGRSKIEADCFGALMRLPFDQLLVRIGAHFVEARAGLCESVSKEEVQRMLPLIARKCAEWVPGSETSIGEFQVRAWTLINEYFDMGELEDLAFEFELVWDNLEGITRIDKARELVKRMMRLQRSVEMINLLRQKRPQGDWPEPITD